LQRVPIRYGGEVLGELHLEGEKGRLDGSALALGEQFAQRCAHLIKRYEAKAWAEQALSRPLLLVGAGEALKQMDEFVSARRPARCRSCCAASLVPRRWSWPPPCTVAAPRQGRLSK
jgi:GAF domain-containing protein